MKRLKNNSLRLRVNHSRYPHDLIIIIDGENAKCKYCGRSPLVRGFDFWREVGGVEETCCFECAEAGRNLETTADALISLGYVFSGIKNYVFPWSPEPGTPRISEIGTCNKCGKPVFYNNYTCSLVDAYHEILRDIYVHKACGY